ncbi:hypothetical protein AB0H71_18315 [Nocardia sp. NPDC050697]|uniref:hypothetical protein n=1 Tax=Nocardia sp. NPDC050697 TaxID=3155158 RepID=UPI0033D6FC53
MASLVTAGGLLRRIDLGQRGGDVGRPLDAQLDLGRVDAVHDDGEVASHHVDLASGWAPV